MQDRVQKQLDPIAATPAGARPHASRFAVPLQGLGAGVDKLGQPDAAHDLEEHASGTGQDSQAEDQDRRDPGTDADRTGNELTNRVADSRPLGHNRLAGAGGSGTVSANGIRCDSKTLSYATMRPVR